MNIQMIRQWIWYPRCLQALIAIGSKCLDCYNHYEVKYESLRLIKAKQPLWVGNHWHTNTQSSAIKAPLKHLRRCYTWAGINSHPWPQERYAATILQQSFLAQVFFLSNLSFRGACSKTHSNIPLCRLNHCPRFET